MRVLRLASGMMLVLSAGIMAFGQAIAEGAMVHANSAAAGAKMGSSLGNAFGRANARNAAAMRSATHNVGGAGKIQYVPQAPRTAGAPANSANASGPIVITSIQGSHKSCTPALAAAQANAPAATAPAGVTSSPAANTPATATPGPATAPSAECGAPAVQRASKSVINVTFK